MSWPGRSSARRSGSELPGAQAACGSGWPGSPWALLQGLDDVAGEAGASGTEVRKEQARDGRPALDDHRTLVREGAKSEEPVVAAQPAGADAAEREVGIGKVQE